MISEELLSKTLEKINKTTTAYNYFFNKINNPAWLLPLKEKGFFAEPPTAIHEDGYIQFPAWPESGYLARIADKAQDEVLDIIKSLPETDNERVMDDVVNALLKIDPAKAVSLTETVKKYVNSSRFLLLNQSTSEFVCKLADGGYSAAALGLAEEMLEVLPDPDQETKLKEGYVRIEPTTKYRDHDYKTILEKVTPSLAEAAPLITIKIYTKLLQNAISYEFTTFKESDEEVVIEEKEDDHSYISRPNIAEDDDYSHELENNLITALRDSVVALMQDSSISDVDKLTKLKELATNKYTIFKRIVEYALRDHKSEEAFKVFYDTLIQEEKLKTILENERRGIGKMTTGFVTEKPTEVLKNLSDAELIEKLKTYKDESGWSFERDSISQELGEMVKLDPKRFVPLLSDVANTKNEYFDETIRAFEEVADSLNDDDAINITTVLVNIYKAGNTIKDQEQRDYYSWSKASSIRLIEKLVSQKEDKTESITAKSLSVVTELLLLLCREQDPTKEDDSNFEPVDLSINSNRGKALHAVAYLLHWMNRNKIDKAQYKSIFDELDWHLKPENDPVPAIRAVYGWRFELLYGTDEDWAKKNIDTIFSDDELGMAAFDAYVMFNRVHEEALKILDDVFQRQLPRLATPPPEDSKARHNGLRNFVQHLALHYWYSSLDLSDGSIMSTLLKTADQKYLKELVNFIGFRLYKNKATKTEDDQLKKLTELWETIVSMTKEDATKLEALGEFGGWFASGKFDPEWSLEQLTYAASKTSNINLDFAVLEYMQTLSESYPAECIKALATMVDSARERWAISSWSKNAVIIIQRAYSSSDSNIKKSALDLANKLVAKGYTEYRNIVASS